MQKRPNSSEILAENLNALMDANSNLNTLVKVAEKSGLGGATINRIKNRQSSPTLDSVDLLAETFNLDVRKLLSKGMVVDSANESTEIYAVVNAMKDIDQNGQTKMRIAAMEAYELHKLHLAKLKQQSNNDLSEVEQKIIDGYRKSDALHKEMIVVGVEEALKSSVGNTQNLLKKSG